MHCRATAHATTIQKLLERAPPKNPYDGRASNFGLAIRETGRDLVPGVAQNERESRSPRWLFSRESPHAGINPFVKQEIRRRSSGSSSWHLPPPSLLRGWVAPAFDLCIPELRDPVHYSCIEKSLKLLKLGTNVYRKWQLD